MRLEKAIRFEQDTPSSDQIARIERVVKKEGEGVRVLS